MVKVKICGLRSLQDVEAASGADAMGFIVETPRSQRNLPLEIARLLLARVPLFTSSVLVTQIKDPLKLGWLVIEAGPHALQVHTELSAIEVKRIRQALPAPVKLYSLLGLAEDGGGALKVQRARQLAASGLNGLILDTKTEGWSGGTGRTGDWALSRKIRDAIAPFPVILAGGLNTENVLEAIRQVEPYAVDVSSGLEEGEAKSRAKILDFLNKVRSYGHQGSD
jgi:phosphoribosylanthranilate isomerase